MRVASLRSIDHWDDEADVVVVGYGLAGAAAAIEAHDQEPDADVLILEKMPRRFAGGNSRASGQSLSFPTDADKYISYQRALNEPNPIPESLLRAWAIERVRQREWVETMAHAVGFELAMWTDRGAEFPELPGADCIEMLYTLRPSAGPRSTVPPRVASTYPAGAWLCFEAHVERRPAIRVRFETPAVDLVQDPDTLEVFGVLCRSGDGNVIRIKARRGVVMCTGGYEFNPQMIRDYAGYQEVHPYGTPGNVGDGIRMLQKAGAALWHLRNPTETGGLHPGIPAPGYNSPFLRNPHMTAWSWLDLARDDRRFYAEAQDFEETHFKQLVHGRWEDTPIASVLPVHMIFDEHTRTADCLVARGLAWAPVVEGYRWSPDNSAEIERGWIVRADSIRELAGAIGRDPASVEGAVERYNSFARSGRDDDFGRAPERMRAVEKAPFYAVAIVAGLVCTTGGGRRDECGRVLDHEGSPIPRLYEAGELGSFHSNLYQNGSFLTEALLTGRWAGASAVRQRAWTEETAWQA